MVSFLYNGDNKAEIKRLRSEVQVLRDELAKMKRTFEDILYNLDTDNFSSRFVKEQGDLRTAIEVTAKGIKTMVSKSDLDEELKEYSTIEQTAENISSVVAKKIDLNEAIPVTKIPDDADTDEIYVIKEKISGKMFETYYCYNNLTKKWEPFSGNNIYSLFEQTIDGFRFKAKVVKISGDLITEGKITGIVLQSFDDNDNVIKMTDGYLYLLPDGATKASFKLGMNTDGDNPHPFMIFGAGTGVGSEDVAGTPSVAGAMTLYKSEGGFEFRFKPSYGNKEQGIWFYDVGNNIEPHIGFGNSTVDFKGATVNGLKITFG